MYTRDEAIQNYVNQMNGVELRDLVQSINIYDGEFNDLEWLDMEDFDEYMEFLTPTQIADRICYGDFRSNDDYFRYDGHGNLESANIDGVERDIRSWLGDVIDYLQETHYIDTWDNTLEELVEADDNTMFNEDYEEVEEEEEEE